MTRPNIRREAKETGEVEVKRIAIVQSCYIPWKGYFDLINSVDEFVLYDESQYTRQDWRNRNRVKTSSGTRWLTIPVTINGLYNQRIDETRIADARWAERHWAILHQAYRRASQYDVYADEIQAAYERVASKPLLSDVNRTLLEAVCRVLDIRTTMSWSTNYRATGSRTDRVVSLCEAAGATVYVSGPRGRDYLDEELFTRAGIELEYFEYAGYREYTQPYPPFDHAVSILDLLFSTGRDATQYMTTFRVKVGR